MTSRHAHDRPDERRTPDAERVRVDGKFLRLGEAKWYLKGLSYGPFAPNRDVGPWPDRLRVSSDFAHMRELGANAARVYHPPPCWLLDEALAHGLRILIDVPWEKHRCFLEDWSAQEAARARVRSTARALGAHSAVFAISVVNEIPNDVVRFYGRRRVEQFIDELIDIAKQEAPDCPTTFVNFPTTEFLLPTQCDFHCFNVYLHDAETLGGYLDRLQHLAGNLPLVLGEFGIDSLRNGEAGQAQLIEAHINEVFRHGLCGSFVFAYTDDWFTGGHQIEDWAFGVTRRDRSEKQVAEVLREAWRGVPHADSSDLPSVSVVVCSYNGAQTLRECLQSLTELQYPSYEVILVDDGSEDHTPTIAADFPDIIYVRQRNRGLSAARNVGAATATGDIVAYTDSDCVVDEHWLGYLVQALLAQRVEAIGGPNITPPSDNWVAKCVAASPGNPSHVMLDDRYAEHVPGCNMAFRRETLLGLGGFDPQFRQAGDDIDICWRFLDAGLRIGYAPAALVWHHRRATVAAYWGQQKEYGRSEATVHFKHPQRCGAFGRTRWQGVIYGDGAVGLALMPETIYHGRFGSGAFQTIYRHNRYSPWAYSTSLEWHLAALFFLALATLWWPLALVTAAMWMVTLALVIRSAWTAPLRKDAPWWCRVLVTYLHLVQPVIRGWYREIYLQRKRRLPRPSRGKGRYRSTRAAREVRRRVKRISASEHDLYWQSDEFRGRDELLAALVEEAQESGWWGDFDNAWSTWDLKLAGDRWHDITIRTATEELGWPHRFTRARCSVLPTAFHRAVAGTGLVWSVVALISLQPWAMFVGLAMGLLTLVSGSASRRRCLRAVTALVARAGQNAKLGAVGPAGEPLASVPREKGAATAPAAAGVQQA